MKRTLLAASTLVFGLPAAAQDASQERLSRECNVAYAKACKGIAPGPELVGQCFEKHPDIMNKIPKKCEADFQTNVENYREAKGQQ